MKEISAFLCSNGQLFTCEKTAIAYEDDLLGQEVNELIKLFNFNITHVDIYKGCLKALNDRSKLKTITQNIIHILNYQDQPE